MFGIKSKSETSKSGLFYIHIYPCIDTASVTHHAKGSSRHGASEHRVHKWREEAKTLAQRQIATNKEIQILKQKVSETNKVNSELEKKLTELQALVAAQREKAKEQDLRMDFLSRLIENDNFASPSSSKGTKRKRNSALTYNEKQLTPQRKKRTVRNVSCQPESSRKRLKRNQKGNQIHI